MCFVPGVTVGHYPQFVVTKCLRAYFEWLNELPCSPSGVGLWLLEMNSVQSLVLGLASHAAALGTLQCDEQLEDWSGHTVFNIFQALPR